jgi:phosphohistidine phosphatase
MELFIIRHAWAEERGEAWPDDSQRPLTAKGRERFRRVVETLAPRGLAPQVIATSPMVRCAETAEILAKGLRGRVEVMVRGELLPDGDWAALWEWTVQEAKRHERIAWVGHAPDVNRLVAAAMGTDGWIRFSKGAIAALGFGDLPEPGQGELRWLVTAKVLGC